MVQSQENESLVGHS